MMTKSLLVAGVTAALYLKQLRAADVKDEKPYNIIELHICFLVVSKLPIAL